MRFRAEVPPAARNLDYFLPTSRLKIKQNWTTPLNHIRVGDSVSRTVVVSAQKMRAMLIPPIALSAPEGVRIYQRAPSVEDQESETGEFVQGVRTETASYLFTKSGDFILPEVKITRWDLATQKLVDSKLPAVTVHVAESDAYISELPPSAIKVPCRRLP